MPLSILIEGGILCFKRIRKKKYKARYCVLTIEDALFYSMDEVAKNAGL